MEEVERLNEDIPSKEALQLRNKMLMNVLLGRARYYMYRMKSRSYCPLVDNSKAGPIFELLEATVGIIPNEDKENYKSKLNNTVNGCLKGIRDHYIGNVDLFNYLEEYLRRSNKEEW